jgi:ribonuclease HI
VTPAEVVVYCDGGARGNPGPAALGASIQTPDGAEIEAIAEAIGVATNNVAEYRAVLRGLERAAEIRARIVLVRTDSQLLVEQLNGRYKVRKAHLRDLHGAVIAAARAFERVTYEHVPRERNARADELVNAALDAGADWTDPVPGE